MVVTGRIEGGDGGLRVVMEGGYQWWIERVCLCVFPLNFLGKNEGYAFFYIYIIVLFALEV